MPLETLLPLKIPPGLVNNGTTYQSKGRWYTGNLVRFHEGRIMPVGGWSGLTVTGATMSGVPNAAIWYTAPSGSPASGVLVVGTTRGLYQVNVGATDAMVVDITPSTLVAIASEDHTWQFDLFGSYLVAAAQRAGSLGAAEFTLHVWTGAGLATRETAAPRVTFGVFTTPERFLVALRGCPPGTATDYSTRTAYWASQETTATWSATPQNTAGDRPFDITGDLVCGAAVRGLSLIWSNVDLWAMTYVGGDFVYGFSKVGDNCGIVSPQAKAVIHTTAYWMGNGQFFAFDNYVTPIPCDVTDYVFGNFNTAQQSKVWTLPNPRFGEVTWFYPSSGSTECDRYVTYNYQEQHWSFGTLGRTAGVPQIGSFMPILAASDQLLYAHETGNVHTGSTPSLESGPVEIGDGDQVMRIQQIVPDDETQGDVTLSLITAMYPNGAETTNGPYTAASPTSVRLTARQVRIKITEAVSAAWRVGVVRLGIVPGGRR